MTREEIYNEVDFKEEPILSRVDPSWTTWELQNAMVAAYNRALEDAIAKISPSCSENNIWWMGDLINELEIK